MFATRVFVALSIVCLAFGQPAPPKISDSFTAQTNVTEFRGGSTFTWSGIQFEDATNNRTRYDFETIHEQKQTVQDLRLYETQSEYRIRNQTSCVKASLEQSFFPAFNWVASAQPGRQECHQNSVNRSSGQLWLRVDDQIEAALCVDRATNSVPFWVETRDPNTREGRHIIFVNFTAGVPSASIFTPPANCT